MKYHINDAGEPGLCQAKIKCRFGESEGGIGHYPSPEDAQKAYERHMVVSQIKTMSKHQRIRYPSPHKDADEEQRLLQDCRDRNRELSQIQIAKHTIFVEETLKTLVENGYTTDKTHAKNTKVGLVFNEKRVKAHQEIVEEYLNNIESVPSDGKALFAGGLGGAGKSTVLESYAEVDQSQYATLNPDDIKEIMAERGLIPEVKGLTPMEASPLIHEEASHITSVIFAKLREKKKNIIFDITMSSLGSVQNRVLLINKAGYKDIQGIFVDIKPETSHERGDFRYRQGLQAYLKEGKGNGGRFLPKGLTEAQKPKNDSPYNSQNAENFIKLEKLGGFTSTPRVFDNDVFGRDPEELSFKKFKNKSLIKV